MGAKKKDRMAGQRKGDNRNNPRKMRAVVDPPIVADSETGLAKPKKDSETIEYRSDSPAPKQSNFFAWTELSLAVAVVVIGGWQLKTMNDAIGQTQQTIEIMQLDQRPWLTVDLPEIDKLEVGKRPSVRFTIANSGKTPARIVSGEAGVFIEPANKEIEDRVKEFDNWASEKKRGLLVAPNFDLQINVVHGPEITTQSLEHINAGVETLYLGVSFVYVDTEGNRHKIRRLFWYYPEAKVLATQSTYDEMD